MLDPTICSPKCQIKDIQENKGSFKLYQSFYNFVFITSTSIEDIDLVCKDFINFYILMNSIITLFEDALAMFSNLLHFLDSWVVYRKKGNIISQVKTHTIEFLEAKNIKNQAIMNMTMPQR